MWFPRFGLVAFASLPVVLSSVGCEEVLVHTVPVASVQVLPAEATLGVGETLELDFVARGEGGDALSGRTALWTVANAAIAEVDQAGVLSALAPGQTMVRARAEGVTGEGVVVVLSRPAIGLSRTTVTFQVFEGFGDPAAQMVVIQNAGGGTLAGLNTAVSYATSQPTGWLRTELTATTAPAQLILRPEVAQLPRGTFTAFVQVQSPMGENSPQTVQVTLTVSEAPPRINIQVTDVLFTATEGATAPATIGLAVTNGGGGQLTGLTVANIQYTAGQPTLWLQAAIGSTAPTTLFLQAHAGGLGGLPPGQYNATVTVAAPTASNTPVIVSVTFRITP